MNTLNSPGKTHPRPERQRRPHEQVQQQDGLDIAGQQQQQQPGQRDDGDELEDASANHPNDDEDV